MKTLIWSVVLYGSEIWTKQNEDIKRVAAFEMWLWRKKIRVKWTKHKTNEEVLGMVQKKRVLINKIRDRQKKWIGHVLRSDSLLRTVWEGRMEVKKVEEDQERSYLAG